VTHRTKPLFALGLWLALLLQPALALADGTHPPAKDEYAEELQRYVPGANRIEGMIRAPCCMSSSKQTLDIHGSEVANALRREIRRRLLAGESEDAIVASIVDRYGPEVLAVKQDSPLKGVAILLSLTMGLAGIGAVVMLRRWRARGTISSRKELGERTKATSAEYDARLDAELRALDD